MSAAGPPRAQARARLEAWFAREDDFGVVLVLILLTIIVARSRLGRPVNSPASR